MAMGSGSDTSVDNSNASGASDKTGTESDNVVMVGGSFEKDGLKGTVNDADTDFTDYDDPYGFYKPGDGKKYVKADFSFENNGKSDAYVSSADFSCYADNESCDQSFIADLIQPILPVSLFSKEQVSVMDRVKCSPKNTNASHRILHYRQDYRFSCSSRSAVRAEITFANFRHKADIQEYRYFRGNYGRTIFRSFSSFAGLYRTIIFPITCTTSE